MKRLDGILIALCMFALPLATICAVLYADDPSTPLPDSSFWAALLDFIRGLNKGTTMAIVASFVQLSIVFFRTSFGKFAGVWKLVIVLGLSVVYAFVLNLMKGLPFLECLLDGTVTSALMVFVNEFIKHIKEHASSTDVVPVRG